MGLFERLKKLKFWKKREKRGNKGRSDKDVETDLESSQVVVDPNVIIVEPNLKKDNSKEVEPYIKEVEPNFKEDSSKVDMKDIIEKLEASAMKKDGMIEDLRVIIWYIIYITVI